MPLILAKFWPYIAGGLAMLGLLIALAVTRHTLASRTEQLKVSRQQTANEIAKEQIDLASIAEMRRNLDAKNAESDARAKALADSKATDAQNVAAADARQKADRSRIQTLQALAKDLPIDPHCRAPAAVVTNLEGL
jgi:hypothetical protein